VQWQVLSVFSLSRSTSKAVELIIAGDCAGPTPHSLGVGKGVFTMTIDQGEFEKISIRISLRYDAGA